MKAAIKWISFSLVVAVTLSCVTIEHTTDEQLVISYDPIFSTHERVFDTARDYALRNDAVAEVVHTHGTAWMRNLIVFRIIPM